jgi:SAM-dependent methyltransferase
METQGVDDDDEAQGVTAAELDDDYHSFVGPSQQYDLMGAMQFSLLYALGLRSRHRLLDIGCGSLRAGRLFIAYLDKGRYSGLEPNKWLIDDAIENDLGREIMGIKSPTFAHNDQFDVSSLGDFDFILAQSIASHTGPAMTRLLLRSIEQGLRPGGKAAVTFIHTSLRDNPTEGWFYPQCVKYRRETIDRWIREAGLVGTPMAWFHPRQTWWVLARDETHLPPRFFTGLSWGGTLAMGRSWKPGRRARRRADRWVEPVIELLPTAFRRRARQARTVLQKVRSGPGKT